MKLFGATSEHFLKIPLIRGHYSLCTGTVIMIMSLPLSCNMTGGVV